MRPLSEQTILVTGATDGLGRALVGELALEQFLGQPVHLAQLGEIGAYHLDPRLVAERTQLGGVAAVGQHARAPGGHERLDVLVNNAGVGTGRDPSRREESHDGYELRFAVNYLAAYHLTRRLLPLLRAPARVVNIASAGQQEFSFTDPQLRRHYSGAAAYMRSKLALVMFTLDLADQLDGSGITVNALHPATFMDTTMVRESGRIPVTAVADGVAATLRLVAGEDVEGETGRFFDGDHEAPPHPQARSPKARERLRRLSDELVTDALA
ncbi:SDR family NAD(P)-dependent oxidoreductase [Saccharomonospora piscinae]|uniref:SDR family NAD(P)-dependent oxidoreductase n=1 Tax=Saccharomonospora piscinae TaxID=687388 RepID=UPI000466C9DD|nr:SDR family NAD(P)-dependent oxidoreductase [Saccharomonospora piscinae]